VAMVFECRLIVGVAGLYRKLFDLAHYCCP